MTTEKKYSIGEFAKVTGVTERTLRHYDQIGLLAPAAYTEHGHRTYNERSITELQRIAVLKFLDMSLEEIAEHLKQSEQDVSKTLATQARMLEEKRKQIDTVLQTIARVQDTMSASEEIDSDSLLMLIHALKNEEPRTDWLTKHAPDSVYNKLHAYTAPLEVEEEMITWTSKMKRLIHEGKAPNDSTILAHADAMISMMKPAIKPLLEDDEAVRQLHNHDGSFQELDPYLFPSSFTKEEEIFMEKVIEELIASKIHPDQP